MLCRQTAFPCSHRCLISLRAHPKQFCSAILLFFSFFFPNCHALQIFVGALPSWTNFWCSHSPRKERVKFEVASYAGARLGKGDQWHSQDENNYYRHRQKHALLYLLSSTRELKIFFKPPRLHTAKWVTTSMQRFPGAGGVTFLVDGTMCCTWPRVSTLKN